MAERLVSPAVFTNEIDSTYLIEGISEIGGAVIGPFSKGPAFSPTIVRSVQELEDLFGVAEGKYYQPYTAREYLINQGVVTIVRIGDLEGWKVDKALALTATYNSGSLADDATDRYDQPISEGEISSEPMLIGVLANTLLEADPTTGALISRVTIAEAGPDATSVGFLGSSFMENGVPASSVVVSSESPTATIMLRGGSSDDAEFTFHMDTNNADSIHNIFGRSAQKNVKPAYFESYFEDTQAKIFNLMQNGATFTLDVNTSDDYLNFQETDKDGDGDFDANDASPYDGAAGGKHALRPANTPFIMSQEISGARYELFRFFTRSYGVSANTEIKVAIHNVKTPGSLEDTDYGTFDVMVRGFFDDDKTMDVREDFRGCTLDPLSPFYLPRVIGDRFTYINPRGKIVEKGDYGNGSNWIRVEMPLNANAPRQCMPYGHGPYSSPVGNIDLPEPEYSAASMYENVPGRFFSGLVFNEISPDGILKLPEGRFDAKELFSPIPENAGNAGTGFYLDEPQSYLEEIDGVITKVTTRENSTTGVSEPLTAIVNPAPGSEELAARGHRRFMVGFQGGDNGHSPVKLCLLGEDILPNNVQGLDCSKSTSFGSRAYKQAFNALSNQDEFDINLLVTPGLSLDLHRAVINDGVTLCETREDCFYILDVVSANGQPGKVSDAVAEASTIDSSYAATYYPWVKIIDPATNVLQAYPPSAIMPAVYSANDKSAAEWFAPAGLNRGGLEQAVSVMDRLTFAERDELYEGKVNPIAAFPGQGIVAFGQKTLQRRASALDRVNVRRLLITLKKFIASTSRYLLFEQNVAATRQRFNAIVNPYLEAVQQRQGLYAFRVIMDESNNTPDLIDRNILYGQIFLQPARAVEYVILDFNITPTGASFG